MTRKSRSLPVQLAIESNIRLISKMDEYHIRSMVEAVFSSIKRCFGPDIKSIKGWLKRRELAIKVLAYNIKRVLYIDFWDEAAFSVLELNLCIFFSHD